MPVFETWLLHQNQAQRAARTCEKRAVLTVLPSSTASFMSTSGFRPSVRQHRPLDFASVALDVSAVLSGKVVLKSSVKRWRICSINNQCEDHVNRLFLLSSVAVSERTHCHSNKPVVCLFVAWRLQMQRQSLSDARPTQMLSCSIMCS